MKRLSPLLVILSLAACASTGIVATGADTYMVADTSQRPGAAGAPILADLYREAGAFCKAKGGNVETIATATKDHQAFVGLANARLDFRCVK